MLGSMATTRALPHSLATEFRHKITDALYDLVHPYECNDAPDYVVMHPVVKVTERYVWVHGRHHWDRERLMRFSRDDLERKGCAWNRPNRLTLYTRPMPDWPLLVVDIRDIPRPELTA
jgi:hypothetical protein